MSIGVPSLCLRCSRYRYESGVDPDGVETGTCDSFPEGIPVEIFAGGFDHREPFGDEELLFDPAPGVSEAEIEEIVASADDFDEDE